jgi:hypothetical protein
LLPKISQFQSEYRNHSFSDDCLLASAGQDNIVRLWRLSEIETSDLLPSTVADLPIDKDIRLRPKVIAISNTGQQVFIQLCRN